jgi:hypothetical protein
VPPPTSIPPYLLFQTNRVPSLTPCSRASSAIFRPASCSFRMPTICSSLRYCRDVRAYSSWLSFSRAGHAIDEMLANIEKSYEREREAYSEWVVLAGQEPSIFVFA